MALRDIILKLAGLLGSRQYLVDNIASPDLVASILVIFANSDGVYARYFENWQRRDRGQAEA